MEKASLEGFLLKPVVFVLILSALAVVLPWQIKPEYLIDFDKPPSSAFTRENPGEIKYNGAVINLPGAGDAGSNSYKIEFQTRGAVLDRGGLQPQMFFYVNGEQIDAFQLEIKKVIKTYTLDDISGSLKLEFQIPREQNVKLRYVKVYYLKVLQLDAKGFSFPPIDIFFKLITSMLIVFCIPLIFKCKNKTAFLIFIFYSSTVLLSLVVRRLQTAVLADLIFIISVVILGAAIVIRAIQKYLLKYSFGNDTESKYFKAFLVAAVFFLGIKLLFTLHPSLISLDLGYHTRNLKTVLSGNLNLITVYPGDIYKIPYPPLFYLLVAPFTLITSQYRLLFKIIFAVIEVLSPVLLGLIARRLFGGMKYAFWTFLSYSLIPFSYRCISAGFIAEQFAQLLFLVLVLVILKIKKYDLKTDILLIILLFAILMSHFGIVIKFYISFLALLVLSGVLKRGALPVIRLIILLTIATIATYAVFYINYNDMMLDGIKKVLANRSPIPDEMQKSVAESLVMQIKYFGRYFLLPAIAALMGMIIYTKEAAKSGIFNAANIFSKETGKKELKRKKGVLKEDLSPDDKKHYTVGLWLLLSYAFIFLLWWLTPLKVRHFNFSLIVAALFSGYFISILPGNLRRYRIYIITGLCIQIGYLFVILNRLVFYFYRVFIN